MEDNYVKFDDSITKTVSEQFGEEVKAAVKDISEEIGAEDVILSEDAGAGEAALNPDQMKKLQAMLAQYHKPVQQVRKFGKIGRNDPCPCGSGNKYKNCCLTKGEYEGLKNVEKYNR